MTERRFNTTLALMSIGYLVVAIVTAQIDRPFFWGINHLGYYPDWVWVTGSAMLLLVAVPQVRHRVLSLSLPSFPQLLVSSALIGLGLVCFVLARDTTHLLGDGYLLPRELERGFRKIANEPLTIWVINRTYGVVRDFGISSSQVYTHFSFASGVAFLCLLPGLSRRLTGETQFRWVVALLLTVPAYVQLFFGYHETYPVLYPLMLLYVWLGLDAIRGHIRPWIPGLVLGFLVAMHFTMATISLSFLAVLAPSGRLADRVKVAARRSYEIVPGAMMFLLSLWVTGFDLAEYQKLASAETFLPLMSAGSIGAPYAALSGTHVFEFMNQILLVYLPSLLLLPFVWRTIGESDCFAFILMAAIPAFVATFFGFTVIGAFRDWDALAFPALFATILCATSLVRSIDGTRVGHIALVVVAVGTFQTGLFVVVNAESVRATERYEDALNYAHMSDRARSYGWETIGSHYLDIDELGKASLAYERAMEIDAAHPRYPSSLGVILMQVGDFEGAARNFERSVALDDQRPETLINLGLAKLQLGEHDAAIGAIRKAWVLDEDSARIPFVLGVAYYAMKEYRKAIGAYRASLQVDPRNADAHMNIGQLYGLVSENDQKARHLRSVLEIRPDHDHRDEILAWLVWYAEQNG